MAESARLARIELDGECWLEHGLAWIAQAEATRIYTALLSETIFERRTIVMFGREILQPREIAWAGDFSYAYSGDRLEPRPWCPELARLRARVNDETGRNLNHALLNLYRDGRDSMGAHSDDEKELGRRPVIASLSFGATRRFVLRPKQKGASGRLDLELAHGDLLVMRGATQARFKHALPKDPRVDAARLNVTFREIFDR